MPYARNNAHVGPRIKLRLTTLAVASACATLAPAYAQDAAAGPGSAATTDMSAPSGVASTNTVTVTGIRASMQSTLNLKRNSDGIVDGIVADDIGKFPDTNLAEAVQRISGVSIDRQNGEGSRVTIRGVGPDLNLVLLNGRQMPSANIGNSGSRSFDFASLASEAVSQIQVYKSARADSPPGGIGATLNIMTGRPLDLGNQTSVGGKVVYDASNNNLPGQLKGKPITPEVSTLISRKFGEGDMFGLSLSASYQSRNSGFASAQIPNGYLGPFKGTTDTGGSLDGSKGIQNLGATQLYDTPQNLSYVLQGTQRKRTNAQLTFQFRPTKDWTNTLDYTYAKNKQQTMANSLNVWMGGHQGVTEATFKNGPVQIPQKYTEVFNPAQELAMVSQLGATKQELKSVGFNTQYRVNAGLKFSLDAHHSVAEAGSDGPYGTNNDLSSASFGKNATTVDLTKEMPVLSVNYTPGPWQVNGSWFQDEKVKQTIDQVQAAGSLKIGESSTFNFGAGSVKTKFDSAFQQVQSNAWSGTVKDRANAGKYYDQANFQPIDFRRYFSKLGGHDDPNLFPTMWIVDFAKVRQDAIKFTSANGPDVNHAGQDSYVDIYSPSLKNPSTVRALEEKSNSFFGQYNTEWDTAMPIHTGFGVRYEKTKVNTNYQIQPPIKISWDSQNEFNVTKASQAVGEAQNADYHYWLPTADFDIDVLSNVKLRASWSVNLGRPAWSQIQGGTTFAGTADVRGMGGNTGNPGLRPVKSNNLDLSAEWYYSKQSMVSLGLYNKDLSGYAGSTTVIVPSTTATTPVGGKYWNAAVASGCGSDTFCIRDYIFTHFAGQPGVTATGPQPDGHQGGKIEGIPGDPGIPLRLGTTANLNKSNLKGAEINWQHMFSNGFGFNANYTYVKSDLKYRNDLPATINGVAQFAMVGMSNSANLVGIYENDKTSVRLAYNWRGEFLFTTGANNQSQPGYTEPYGQLDLSVGYNLTKNLALSFEAINLTNATQRQHGRDKDESLNVNQFGTRYMIGARYKF